MLDVVHSLDLFHLRILEENPGNDSVMNHEIEIFIDRGGDDEAAVLVVVRREVGPPAAQGNS